MTTAFISAVSSNPYGHSYPSILDHIRMAMRARGLKQMPQLSSTQAFPINRPFNLTDVIPNRNPVLGRQPYNMFHNKKNKKQKKKYKKNKYMGGDHFAGGPAGLSPLSGILIGGTCGIALNQLL